jgi:hypothetical protein
VDAVQGIFVRQNSPEFTHVLEVVCFLFTYVVWYQVTVILTDGIFLLKKMYVELFCHLRFEIIVCWVVTPCRIIKFFPVFLTRVASIFSVTELRSGGC